ncbi:hypothetical protein O9929_19540 [Vibrio lentus]|nr:hypothetical protein [Vibrio lentus]
MNRPVEGKEAVALDVLTAYRDAIQATRDQTIRPTRTKSTTPDELVEGLLSYKPHFITLG